MSAEYIAAWGGVFSAIGTLIAVSVAWRVYKGQKLLSQRQLLLPLWTYISSLNSINPSEPITPEILKAVNTLELVALCCEGGMVDSQVIKRTFGDLFILLYEQVNSCSQLPGMKKTGHDLLMENRAAMAFHQELLKEHINRGRLAG